MEFYDILNSYIPYLVVGVPMLGGLAYWTYKEFQKIDFQFPENLGINEEGQDFVKDVAEYALRGGGSHCDERI